MDYKCYLRRKGSPEQLKEWGFSVEGKLISCFETRVRLFDNHYLMEVNYEISDGNPNGGSVNRHSGTIGIENLDTPINKIDSRLMNETETLLESSLLERINNLQRWGYISLEGVEFENGVTGKTKKICPSKNTILDYQI